MAGYYMLSAARLDIHMHSDTHATQDDRHIATYLSLHVWCGMAINIFPFIGCRELFLPPVHLV